MIEKGLNWLEKALGVIEKYKVQTILKAVLLIIIIALTIGFINNPTYIFEKYESWVKERHDALMEHRINLAPQIQSTVDKLTYKVGATRTVVLEMHNGSTGNGGLPFTKCTATYEGLNIGAYPISQYYQDQNLSLIPFASFLFNKGYWCGNTEELLNIDRALYHKMKSNNTEHFAACVIEGIDKPLAILIVSFEKIPDEAHNCDEIRENIRHIAMELSVFLEVEKMMKEKQK
jgi:hypothetical protein